MSVDQTTSRVSLTATGGQTVFSFTNILVFSASDINVYQNGVLLAPATYTVTLTTPASLPSDGTITLSTGATASDTITIERSVQQTQATVFNPGTAFPAKSHEAALDKNTLISQDNLRKQTYGPQFANVGKDANVGWTFIDLPNAVDTKVPVFNPATKTVTWNDPTTGGSAPTDFSALTGTLNISGTDVRVLDITPGLAGAVARGLDDRVTEFYSVKDFGAVGDGVTDDSTEITACEAAANGGYCYFPSGTYRISVNTTVTNVILGKSASFTIDSGIVLTIDGYIWADPHQVFSGLGNPEITFQRPVFPEWFGAQPGTANDATPALSAAVTACQTADCWIVLTGEYYTLNTAWFVSIRGFRLTGMTGNSENAELRYTLGTGNGLAVDATERCMIERVSFLNTGTPTAGAALKISSSATVNVGSVVRECRFTDNYNGLFAQDVRSLVVENCRFVDNLESAILFDGDTAGDDSYTEIRSCTFDAAVDVGQAIRIESGRGITISGCNFRNHRFQVDIRPKTGDIIKGVHIIGCHFQLAVFGVNFEVDSGHVSSGVSDQFTITGCTFRGENVSIHVDPQNSGDRLFEDIAITGNCFSIATTFTGILIDAQDQIVISGNTFRGAGTAVGILVRTPATNVFASGNHYTGFSAGNEFDTTSATSKQEPRVLYESTTIDPTNLVDGATYEESVTVTGATTSMVPIVNCPALTSLGIAISAYIDSANEVRVKFGNYSGGAIDVASSTCTIIVFDPGTFV